MKNPLPIKDTATFQRFTQFLQQQKVKKENLLLIHNVDVDANGSAREESCSKDNDER